MSGWGKFFLYIGLPALAALFFVLLAAFIDAPGLIAAVPDRLGRIFLFGFLMFVFMIAILSGWIAIVQRWPLCPKDQTHSSNY